MNTKHTDSVEAKLWDAFNQKNPFVFEEAIEEFKSTLQATHSQQVEEVEEEAWAASKLLWDRMTEWNKEWQTQNPNNELTHKDAMFLIEWKMKQQVEEAVRKVTDVVKANVPLERIPSDVQNTKKLIDELMKLHYEPEHEEGQTCWCSPITTVQPTTKKAYIDHQEQRVILRQFIEDNFVSKEEAIASLCLGSNQARRGVLNAIKALIPNHQD